MKPGQHTERGDITRMKILEFIKKFISDNEYSPSVKEISDGLNMNSTGTTQTHLDELERLGFIKRPHGAKSIARSIRIVEPNKEKNHV